MGDEIRKGIVPSMIVHAVAFVAICVFGWISLRPSKPTPIEILTDFTVAVPPPAEEEPAKEEAVQPEPPKKDDITIPEKKPPKKIEISKKKITKKEDKPKTTVKPPPKTTVKPPPTSKFDSKSKLTPEEIQKLLNMGAKPSDHTSIPESESQRCAILIRDQIYAAWVRPDSEAVTGRSPVVTISLGPGGVVQNVTLKSSSGNPVLDASVLSAVRAVGKFKYLSESYIRANKNVTVAFELKG